MGERALEIIGEMDELTKRVKAANEARAAFVEERGEMVERILEKIKQLKLTKVSNGAEIEQLKQQLADNKEQLDKLTQDIKNHTEGGETLQKQIDELKVQIEEKDKELTEVKAKLAESEHVLGMSDTEMVKLKEEANQLKSDLEQVKNELRTAQESQTSQIEVSSDLQKKLEDVDAGLKNTYKNLKKEVEELLNAVGEDNIAQKAILKQVLDALDEGQEAIASRIDDIAVPVSSAAAMQRPTYTEKEQQIIDELEKRVSTYFVGDGKGGYKLINGKMMELTNETPLVMKRDFIAKMNADDKAKIAAYQSNGGPIQVDVKSGGRRKRTVKRMKKRVLKRTAKRRVTQKKRRGIRKRRTMRK